MAERLVASLLVDCPEVAEILVTRNIPESLACNDDTRVLYLENPSPKGFGANHNAAFRRSTQPFFCVLNPDVELTGNPFPELLKALERTRAGVVAPLVKSPEGAIADSVRRFPTIRSLVRKALGGDSAAYALAEGHSEIFPEWVAGMFMLFQRSAFGRLGGFDERFFLYYEDVDICVRAWKDNVPVAVCQRVAVIHDARRDSHRNVIYFLRHLASMARYLSKHSWRLPRVGRNGNKPAE